MPGSGGVVVRQPDQSENPPGSGAQRMVPGRVPLPVWRWGVLDSFLAALCNGPSASFLSAFAVELGAGGGILGLLLALNTFLANGLQLQGAAWARRGSSVSACVWGGDCCERHLVGRRDYPRRDLRRGLSGGRTFDICRTLGDFIYRLGGGQPCHGCACIDRRR